MRALIAGQGALPRLLVQADPALQPWSLAGFPPEISAQEFRLERLVPFLDSLVDSGVNEVCFAGALRRPRLDPEAFDPRTASLVPRLIAAMGQGDDAALRVVIALFEEWGLTVISPDAIAPELLPPPGLLAGQLTAQDEADAARAAEILATTGPLDLGQGCVVAGGLLMALETLPGTDAMLAFCAAHRALKPPRGLLYKAPKTGQDRRIDLPALGPDTLRRASEAGLAGVAFAARSVLLIEREQMQREAEARGLFLWSRAETGP